MTNSEQYCTYLGFNLGLSVASIVAETDLQSRGRELAECLLDIADGKL